MIWYHINELKLCRPTDRVVDHYVHGYQTNFTVTNKYTHHIMDYVHKILWIFATTSTGREVRSKAIELCGWIRSRTGRWVVGCDGE